MQTMDNADETSNATLENSDQIEKDKINQRREARRRKILDNAKNRLEKLNGRTISNDEMMRNDGVPRNKARINNDHFNGLNIKSTENTEFSDPEVEPDLIPQSMRPFLRDSFQFPDGNFANTTLQQDSMPANNFPDIFDMFQTPEVKERHVLFKARLHLVVSALISCVLTIFWKQNGFSIFIPAGICLITDLLFFREQKPLHPILNMIFMMFNDQLPPQMKKFLHIFTIVQSIIVDLGVFIFSFCILMYLMNSFANNHPTELIIIK